MPSARSCAATDENVPQALSGYRPQITATADTGIQHTETITAIAGRPDGAGSGEQHPSARRPAAATQTLFNGFQTANRTRQAESQTSAARETLRLIEQTVLLDAATAYMNLLRDRAILDLQRRNVEVLQEQLRQARDRFNVGEVTRTDVAQAESAAGGGPLGGAHRRGQCHHLARRVPARDRGRTRRSDAGNAGRPLLAAHARHGDSARRAPSIRR